MREIKFRGKRTDNGEWIVGDYTRYPDEKSIIMVDILEEEDYWVSSETVGQYTGLKDKNGKEIYEGDVVKWFGYEVKSGRQVRPERTMCINDYVKDTYRIFCITDNTGQTVEIIGNIHENHELLEVQE